jgi:hypothetical protein
LLDLKYRAALAAYFLQLRFGKIDRQYLIWVRDVIASHRGPDINQKVLAEIDHQLALNDAALSAYLEGERAGPGGAVTVKKIDAPLLSSRLSALWELDRETQTRVLSVRAKLDQFNEEIEEARYFHKLTYSDLDSELRNAVNSTLTSTYLSISELAKSLSNRASGIIGD